MGLSMLIIFGNIGLIGYGKMTKMDIRLEIGWLWLMKVINLQI